MPARFKWLSAFACLASALITHTHTHQLAARSATQTAGVPVTAPLGFPVRRSEVSQQCCRLNVTAHSAVKWEVDACTLMQRLSFISHSLLHALITLP